MIKAIETNYKGYRFRSRLEARWAVFFDALGISWEYELEGFDLGEHGYYLPDFWLPHQGYWFEVKPHIDGRSDKEIVKDHLAKYIALANVTKRHLIVACGTPGIEPLGGRLGEFKIGNLSWVWPRGDVSDDDFFLDMQWVYSPKWGWRIGSFMGGTIDEWRDFEDLEQTQPYHQCIIDAYATARSARFEYGEMPYVR